MVLLHRREIFQHCNYQMWYLGIITGAKVHTRPALDIDGELLSPG